MTVDDGREETTPMKLINGWVDTASEDNLMTNSMSRMGYKVSHIVVHGTAGGSNGNAVIDYMRGAGVSTHFVISVDGTIWQAVSTEVAAWGNAPLKSPRLAFDHAEANPNYWTISVEFAKPDTTNVIDITPAQLASGIALIGLLCDAYGVPKKRGDGHGGIIGHCDINSVDRSMCPGTYPWDALIAGLNPPQPKPVVDSKPNQLEDSGVFGTNSRDFNNFFIVEGQHWHCKQTGHNIGGAIRGFFNELTLDGQSLPIAGLPTSEEIKVTVKGKQAVVQHFERLSLCYDPDHVIDGMPGAKDTYILKVNSVYSHAS